MEPWHGKPTGYYHHLCRCEACSTAATAYKRAYRAGPGKEVERAYRVRFRRLEAENARRQELGLRKLHNEQPVTTMPYYRFLKELYGFSF